MCNFSSITIILLFILTLPEWRNGPTGPLMLTDIDIASYNKDGWRRLNTLSFYRVHDGAYMTLLHRQQTVKYINGKIPDCICMLIFIKHSVFSKKTGQLCPVNLA